MILVKTSMLVVRVAITEIPFQNVKNVINIGCIKIMLTIVNTILVANLVISKIQVYNVKDVIMNAKNVNLLRTLVNAILVAVT